jgi:hypothetical protein
MIKVHCTLDELMAVVAACELEGEWSENTKNGFHAFHAETGEVLNWWPSTGTVQFQGKCPEAFRTRFLCPNKASWPDGGLRSNLLQHSLAKYALDVQLNALASNSGFLRIPNQHKQTRLELSAGFAYVMRAALHFR